MSRAELLALVVAMALVTWGLRASIILVKDRIVFAPWVRRALAYVPPAVFAAIVAPALLLPGGVAMGPVDVRLVAAAVAALVAWRTRNLVATIATGMASVWLLGWIAG